MIEQKIFETKELIPPNDTYSIFVTSNFTKYWGEERFDNYEDGLARYNELLKLSKELVLDVSIEQQIHFVKVVSKYENILSETMMIG